MSDLDETVTYVIRRLRENNHAEFLLTVVLIKRVKYSDATSTHLVLAELTTLFYFAPALEVHSEDANTQRERIPFSTRCNASDILADRSYVVHIVYSYTTRRSY